MVNLAKISFFEARIADFSQFSGVTVKPKERSGKLRPYSDSSHRQLSNGTGLSSRLHRTGELWGSQVWGYCRVLPAPPAPRAFFPLPPVLPHACRTAVRHVGAGDQALTVLISIGLHGPWLELGLRVSPAGYRRAPHGGTPALQRPRLHGPLAPALYP